MGIVVVVVVVTGARSTYENEKKQTKTISFPRLQSRTRITLQPSSVITRVVDADARRKRSLQTSTTPKCPPIRIYIY